MKNGRGEKIRTSDPHNPIVVRYQAALRPDRIQYETRAAMILAALVREKVFLAAQDLENLFKFHAQLLDNLLALTGVCLRIITRKPLASSTNGEPVLIQKAANLTNDQNVLPLIIATITSPLYRF